MTLALSHSRLRSRRTAFTLIELVVVLVIMGVTAAVVIPRAISSTDRAANAEADSIQRLLSIFAQRDAYSAGRVALEYNHKESTLRLLTWRTETENSRDPVGWTPDPGEPAVTLATLELASASADQTALPSTGWLLETFPTEPRARVLLELRRPHSTRRDSPYVVLLEPTGLFATIHKGVDPSELASTSVIDLDAQGETEAPW